MYNEQIKLCQAIVELDEKLSEKGITPFTLNVCGGFALLLQNVRKDVESYTDIDYIGSDLSKDIQEEVINIGYKHGFGNDWINNDILLSGSTLEELEYATGKLHFEPKMQLKVITVNALSKKDLLRMKLIAIDTSYFGMRFGGEFTRVKDFKDIDLLLQDLDMSLTDLYVENMFYVANDTFDLIDYYINTKNETLFTKSFDEIQESVNDYIQNSYFKPDNEQDVEI